MTIFDIEHLSFTLKKLIGRDDPELKLPEADAKRAIRTVTAVRNYMRDNNITELK